MPHLEKFEQIVSFIRSYFHGAEEVPLHQPCFGGNEKQYVLDCIDSGVVSSIGDYILRFEGYIAQYVGAQYAIATVNGTTALHAALMVAGVVRDDEVLTQAVTFVATGNAIRYCGADPVFIDIDEDSMGLSPDFLERWLKNNTVTRSGVCFNKTTGRVVRACIPMHTFGQPCRIEEIVDICRRHNIVLVEDAAEALGSRVGNQHVGNFGDLGVFSFNGNKIITTGGGGVVVTNNQQYARHVRHLTTTAKIKHPWECAHDCIGYNYRMPNINAAIGCAQLEQLPYFLKQKRSLAEKYAQFFASLGIAFKQERPGTFSNYWLNAIIFNDRLRRDECLAYLHQHNIFARPLWTLLSNLDMYKECQKDSLYYSQLLSGRVVNLPSSVA